MTKAELLFALQTYDKDKKFSFRKDPRIKALIAITKNRAINELAPEAQLPLWAFDAVSEVVSDMTNLIAGSALAELLLTLQNTIERPVSAVVPLQIASKRVMSPLLSPDFVDPFERSRHVGGIPLSYELLQPTDDQLAISDACKDLVRTLVLDSKFNPDSDALTDKERTQIEADNARWQTQQQQIAALQEQGVAHLLLYQLHLHLHGMSNTLPLSDFFDSHLGHLTRCIKNRHGLQQDKCAIVLAVAAILGIAARQCGSDEIPHVALV